MTRGRADLRPLYWWGTARYWARAPDPEGVPESELTNSWRLYQSGGSVSECPIPLTGFEVHVGTRADPEDSRSPVNGFIVEFDEGTATGVLVAILQSSGG